MKIKESTHLIEFTSDELYNIACDIARALKCSINDHYNCLQQDKDGESIFFDQEREKLNTLSTFLMITDGESIYIMYVNQFKEMFAVKREERKK